MCLILKYSSQKFHVTKIFKQNGKPAIVILPMRLQLIYRFTYCGNKCRKIQTFFLHRRLTLTRASVRFVHMAISSRVDISGYRFRLNVCSNSCNCCDVKCVRWRRWRLFFLSFFGSSAVVVIGSSWPEFDMFSVLIVVSLMERLPEITTTRSNWKY